MFGLRLLPYSFTDFLILWAILKHIHLSTRTQLHILHKITISTIMHERRYHAFRFSLILIIMINLGQLLPFCNTLRYIKFHSVTFLINSLYKLFMSFLIKVNLHYSAAHARLFLIIRHLYANFYFFLAVTLKMAPIASKLIQ